MLSETSHSWCSLKKWKFWLGSILLLTFGVWLVGFWVFISHIPVAVVDSTTPTDALVVLTGGQDRISTGINLFKNNLAKKLFISGVHEDVDLKNLQQSLPPELAARVVLGYKAEDTKGNAEETSEWMAQENFTSLRLITANYHMMRSLQEFKQAMPHINIIPNPVFPEQLQQSTWQATQLAYWLMIKEYHKTLFTCLRHKLISKK